MPRNVKMLSFEDGYFAARIVLAGEELNRAVIRLIEGYNQNASYHLKIPEGTIVEIYHNNIRALWHYDGKRAKPIIEEEITILPRDAHIIKIKGYRTNKH